MIELGRAGSEFGKAFLEVFEDWYNSLPLWGRYAFMGAAAVYALCGFTFILCAVFMQALGLTW